MRDLNACKSRASGPRSRNAAARRRSPSLTAGAIAGTPRPLFQIAEAVQIDRCGGDLHVVGDPHLCGRVFRLVVCRPEDVGKACRLLLPGGLLLTWVGSTLSLDQLNRALDTMRAGGLDGVSHNQGVQQLLWGIADTKALSPGRVIEAAYGGSPARVDDAQTVTGHRPRD